MKVRKIIDQPTRTFAVVFDAGEEVTSGLLEFARQHKVRSASLSGIGAFRAVTLGYFQPERKEYKRIPLGRQVELLSLVGNIALHNKQPKLHAHVVVGEAEGTARGGHLLDAIVQPTLEVIVVESEEHLVRQIDPTTGLPLLVLNSGE